MKKVILLFKVLLLGVTGFTQLQITPGAQWVTTGNAVVVLQDMDLVNNGMISAGTGSFKFTGSQNSGINGNSLPSFSILEIAKSNNAKVVLNRNISIGASINFISGQLDLNNNNILLGSPAYIAGETEANRIVGANGGFVEITTVMNSPNSTNAGNLGAFITSSANLGSVTIRRGHTAQAGTGLTGGINRYYTIQPTNNSNLDATLRLKYFDAELNGQNENILSIYQSPDDGANWDNLEKTTNSINSNYVEKTGIPTLALQTLSNNTTVAQDGVTGLVFTGQRKKPGEVQLNWTAQTETNMSGYEVERKLDNEADFTSRTFVNSSAPGGNSLSPQSYQYKDANSHTGLSYYRLKLVTLNNAFTYSDVIAIAAKAKGGGNGGGNPNNKDVADDITFATGKPIPQNQPLAKKITIAPNPNNGNFWFRVTGIDKETTATLFYIDGKQIKEFRVGNRAQVYVNGLRSGMYILKIPGFETQKIVVNATGNGSSNPKSIVPDNPKL